MEFNPVQYEVMHLDTTREYMMNTGPWEAPRIRGTLVCTLIARQVDEVVKKRYGILAFISQGIEFQRLEEIEGAHD